MAFEQSIEVGRHLLPTYMLYMPRVCMSSTHYLSKTAYYLYTTNLRVYMVPNLAKYLIGHLELGHPLGSQ